MVKVDRTNDAKTVAKKKKKTEKEEKEEGGARAPKRIGESDVVVARFGVRNKKARNVTHEIFTVGENNAVI